jgi:hypothetical protein
MRLILICLSLLIVSCYTYPESQEVVDRVPVGQLVSQKTERCIFREPCTVLTTTKGEFRVMGYVPLVRGHDVFVIVYKGRTMLYIDSPAYRLNYSLLGG